MLFPHTSSVLPKVVLLSDFFLFGIREAVEICLPAWTEIDMPPPESAY